jgi:hypothetical protein
MELFDDDPSVLPKHLQVCYLSPTKTFGLSPETANTGSVRDAFRRAMLGQCRYFWGLPKNKNTVEQIVFSYHLLRRNITGPASAIKAGWNKNVYMDFRPEDILPTLRPLQGLLGGPREYRGFRNLNVKFSHINATLEAGLLPHFKFVFLIHYCMRKHTIEKTFEEFQAFYSELRQEMLCLPDLPDGDSSDYGSSDSDSNSWSAAFKVPSIFTDIAHYVGVGIRSREAQGVQLAECLQRVHSSLATGGRFSPRLLRFLHIDFEQVQSEEEGAIMAVLDTPILPPQSCWYCVDEVWLAKWRRFATGRGPRRYLPPGRVTNAALLAHALEANGLVSKKWLQKAKHYRCVNCNVWTFYQMVHGGGPAISRLQADIYSPLAVSFLQGVIIVQTRFRTWLAVRAKDILYMQRLSAGKVAKDILVREVTRQRQEAILTVMQAESTRRLQAGMISAALLTQTLWRKRYNIVPEAKLARVMLDQTIFLRARAATSIEGAVDIGGIGGLGGGERGGDSNSSHSVVNEVHPIVSIGTAGRYTRVITETMGRVPFKLKRSPFMEVAVVAESTDGHFLDGSKILSVNNFPTFSMSHEELQLRMSSQHFPLTLELERPVSSLNAVTLDDLMSMSDEKLQYNAFKVMLSNELPLSKHSIAKGARSFFNSIGLSAMPVFRYKPHITRLVLTGANLYYQKRYNVRLKAADLWRKVPLFSVKHVLEGREIEAIANKSDVDPAKCFAIVTEHTELILELPSNRDLERLLDVERRQKEAVQQQLRQMAVTQGLEIPTEAANANDNAVDDEAEEWQSPEVLQAAELAKKRRVLAVQQQEAQVHAQALQASTMDLHGGDASMESGNFTSSVKTTAMLTVSPSIASSGADEGTGAGAGAGADSKDKTNGKNSGAGVFRGIFSSQSSGSGTGSGTGTDKGGVRDIGAEDQYHLSKVRLVVKSLKQLVQEVKSSQWYVDEDGVPTMRKAAKVSLRMVAN